MSRTKLNFLARNGQLATRPLDVIAVAVNHAGAEVREFRVDKRGAGVMWRDAPMFRREAKRDGDVELGQSIHLAMRQIFKRWAADWTLDSYMDGKEAIHSIPRMQPHAVLMDISMPGITGVVLDGEGVDFIDSQGSAKILEILWKRGRDLDVVTGEVQVHQRYLLSG